MSELSFLLDLLLNHKLQKSTRDMIRERVKEVEQGLVPAAGGIGRMLPHANVSQAASTGFIPPHLVGQSPSTIAAMMRHEQNTPAPPIAVAAAAQVDHPPPVAVVAQTPAAQAALAERQAAIASAISGKPEKGRTSPRKF